MELKKRNVLITFTVLSLAACIMMGFQYVGSIAYFEIEAFLNKNQEAGVLRWLSWLFHSPWTDMLVQYVFLLGASYVPAYLLICWLPKDQRKQAKLSGKDILVCTVASMGMGYVLNLAGTFINYLISLVTGTSFLDMNPVVEMTQELSTSMIIYSCLLGPFMEELFCRGFLLKRARVFGDWTAVVFTAIVFGLMHGNISQFLYGTGIGLILGYVAVKANGIKYTVLIHMLVNTYNMALAWGESVIWNIGSEFLTAAYSLAILINMVVLIIGGVILIVKYGRIWYRQMLYHNGSDSLNRIFVYLNPGFAFYVVLCVVEFLSYLV